MILNLKNRLSEYNYLCIFARLIKWEIPVWTIVKMTFVGMDRLLQKAFAPLTLVVIICIIGCIKLCANTLPPPYTQENHTISPVSKVFAVFLVSLITSFLSFTNVNMHQYCLLKQLRN